MPTARKFDMRSADPIINASFALPSTLLTLMDECAESMDMSRSQYLRGLVRENLRMRRRRGRKLKEAA